MNREKSLRQISDLASLATLIVIVIVLSVFVFSGQSLRLDESQSLWQTSHTPNQIFYIIAQDVHVPLYHLLLHYWQLFLGNSVTGGRFLSLIFFVLSVPALYALGNLAFSRRIGMFAATLFSISPFMNWYGNEIRMYTLFTFFTILSQYFFIRIYKRQDRASWFGYLLVNLFGIFTHYFFFFVIFVQIIFYFVNRTVFPRRALTSFLLIAAILAICFSPWVWYVHHLGTLSNEAPILSPPSTVNVFNTFSQFIFGFQNDHLNTVLVSLWPLTILLGFLALQRYRRLSPEAVYMLLSVIVPIMAAFVVSVTLVPLFVSRYLIMTIPAMYLFIGWIFSTYPRWIRGTLEITLIVAMLVGLAVEIFNPSAPVKENYRSAVTYLEKNATPQDVIVLSAPFTIYPVEYYYHGSTEITTLPIWNRYVFGPIPTFKEADLPGDLSTIRGDHERAFLLLSYDQGYEEKIRIYFDTHLERLGIVNFSPGLNLYIYRLRYDPPVLPQSVRS